MSITSDIRNYADSAVNQGKQVLDQAQTQLTGVTGQANEFVGKLTDQAKTNYREFSSKATAAASDLRAQAEKALNLDAIKSAVEPYLAQAKDYSASVTDRAANLFDTVKSDKRVAGVVNTVESVSDAVVETVTERVIKPVQGLTGRSTKPAAKAAPKPAAKKAAPVATKALPRSRPPKRLPRPRPPPRRPRPRRPLPSKHQPSKAAVLPQ